MRNSRETDRRLTEEKENAMRGVGGGVGVAIKTWTEM